MQFSCPIRHCYHQFTSTLFQLYLRCLECRRVYNLSGLLSWLFFCPALLWWCHSAPNKLGEHNVAIANGNDGQNHKSNTQVVSRIFLHMFIYPTQSQWASFVQTRQNQVELSCRSLPVSSGNRKPVEAQQACVSPGSHALSTAAECVLACSAAPRNIPREAKYIPSVSSAHVNLCASGLQPPGPLWCSTDSWSS